jgi:hypothetical protein
MPRRRFDKERNVAMNRDSIRFAVVMCLLTSLFCRAQGTAFTYQGRLNSSGVPANGVFDLVFTIYDLPTGMGSFANQTNAATPVSNGLFTVTLNFGVGIFTGPERWLEIAARTNGPGSYTTLSPRQRITATPYAITAGNITGSVAASQLSGSIAPANIAAGTINSTMLAAGSVTTSNLANGAVTLAKLNTSPLWTSSAVFTNPTPEAGDYFGTALAAVGPDRVIIGAHWDNPGVFAAGAAYLFSTNGTLLTTFTNPSPADQDLFGQAVSAVGGDKLIVGAYTKDVAGVTNTGAAYLFNTNGTLLTTLTNPTPESDDNFGWSVAGVGSDKVVITANNDSMGASGAGAAYVYSLSGTLLLTITNPTPVVNDQFGYQVAAVGADKILISAIADDTGGTDAGAVYLFRTNGALLTTFTNPMPAQTFVFGIRIAAVGNDRLLITAAFPDGTNAVILLYSTNGTLLTTFGPAPGLGISLAFLSPDKVAFGAPGLGVGSVHLFTTNGAPLATIENPNPVNSGYFGYAMAAFGDKLLVGAPLDSTGASEAGVAYLFGIGAQYIPGLVGDGSFAASLGNIAIDSSRIVDGTIAEVDLADGAVSDAKISSVDASKLTGTILDTLLSPNVAFTFANQTFTGVNTFNNAGNDFIGSFTGNGSGLTSVSASTLGGLSSSAFWKTAGNAGTTSGVNFLGTTDSQPLTLRVNNTIALQLQPGVTVPNVVGGLAAFRPSVIASGVSGAVIAGGNAPSGGVNGLGAGDFQAIYDNDGVVGGGFGNKVGSNNGDVTDAAFATVAGGVFNSANGYAATVAGGDGNSSGGSRSAVGGGYGNGASGNFSMIGGGLLNNATTTAAALAGGAYNTINGAAEYSFVGGGSNNVVRESVSSIAGGQSNLIDTLSLAATVGGGRNNRIQAGLALPPFSFTVGDANTIAGGANNLISHTEFPLPFDVTTASVIGGGQANVIQRGGNDTISGGYGNQITFGSGATISGGTGNQVSGDYGTTVGGINNFAGFNSLAAGTRAKANHSGSFIWADSQAADFNSSANNDFSIRASGGVRLNTDTSMFFGNQTRQMLNLWSTAYGIGIQSATVYFRTDTGGGFSWFRGGVHSDFQNAPGAGGTEVMRLDSVGNLNVRANVTANSIILTSDRNAKENFEPVSGRDVLEKVAALPITRWNFKQDTASEHIGPMAQDFHAAFGTGSDDKHIAVVDEGGVALAAIQGLNEKLEGKTQKSDERMEKLELENAALKHELAELKKLVQAIANQ